MMDETLLNRAIIYEQENKDSPLDLNTVVEKILAITTDQVARMSYAELASNFPKYTSGEFRPLQHGRIWEKLSELLHDLPGDCRDYHQKFRILEGILQDGMSI